MSVLTLQFGQCGNQIGETLYSTIYEDIGTDKSQYSQKSLNKWFNVRFNGKLEPRSILIDTETKVISNRQRTQYEFKNIISKPLGGCGNNWAFGYNFRSDGITELVLDKVRSEIEKSDYLVSFLNILSSSGGTGSGVGSKVIEELKNEYPNKLILNAVVLPYLNGEIVTQNYNTVLSIAKLHGISDVQILFENDQLHELCSGRVDHSLNFSDLNRLIASQLASTFQPVGNKNNAIFLSHAASHPLFKYLHLRSSFLSSKHPKFDSNQCWRSLLNYTTRQTKYYVKSQKKSKLKMNEKNITSIIITRGRQRPDKEDFATLKSPSNYVNWMPSNDHFVEYHETRGFGDNDKNLTIVTNGNRICYFLDSVIEDAWTLFSRRAYLHHYKKFYIEEQEFREAFQVMENILAGYNHL